MLEIALLLGGPSEERGISLNSARSVADHLVSDGIRLKEIIYFDRHLRPYSISRGLLYCNTPSDFDFKLSRRDGISEDELVTHLRGVDLVFPVIHGAFGEDGRVQALLESVGVPFVGSGSAACATAFDKFQAKEALTAAGIAAVPSVLAIADMPLDEQEQLLAEAFPSAEKLVLKPAQGGSSIDVHVARSRPVAGEILRRLLTRYDRVVLQPHLTGVEVTTIVLQGASDPVSLIPVQIELNNRLRDDDIFDYRRKYLATNDSHYYCPPRFDLPLIEQIQRISEQVFATLRLRDFARIDGWLEPDGRVLISDINPISGMEQNSFLFIQAAQVGMNHGEVLRYTVRSAARRAKVDWVDQSQAQLDDLTRKQVAVLFGGDTAVRCPP